MPIKSRLIQKNIEELNLTRDQLVQQLEAAEAELSKFTNLVIKQKLKTDDLFVQQSKVDVLKQTVATITSQISDADNELNACLESEKRKNAISDIHTLDSRAEKLGKRYVSLYMDYKNLNYSLFVEMVGIQYKISEAKQQFSRILTDIFPGVWRIDRSDAPDLEAEINAFLDECRQNGCVLSVLRSDRVFYSQRLATDDYNAFRLPENPMSDWILHSLHVVELNEKKNAVSQETDVSRSTNSLKKIWKKLK